MLVMLAGCGDTTPIPTAEPMKIEDFRRELVNMPLCGTPKTGPVAGKAMCTVHFTDGSYQTETCCSHLDCLNHCCLRQCHCLPLPTILRINTQPFQPCIRLCDHQ